MMIVFKKMVWACLVIAFVALPALAAEDYSAMSTEELAANRGIMWEASAEERAAFHNEWRKRVQNMTTEQRRQYSCRSESGPRGGAGMGDGRGKGGGMGRGRR